MTMRVAALSDHCSVRTLAVNPSRLRRDPAGFGDDGSARPSNRRPFHKCTIVMLAGFKNMLGQ
jgi:hypothetical protein